MEKEKLNSLKQQWQSLSQQCQQFQSQCKELSEEELKEVTGGQKAAIASVILGCVLAQGGIIGKLNQ